MISQLDFKKLNLLFILALMVFFVFTVSAHSQDEDSKTLYICFDSESERDKSGIYAEINEIYNKYRIKKIGEGFGLNDIVGEVKKRDGVDVNDKKKKWQTARCRKGKAGESVTIKIGECGSGKRKCVKIDSNVKEGGTEGAFINKKSVEYKFLVKFPFFKDKIFFPGISRSDSVESIEQIQLFIQTLFRTLFVIAGLISVIAITYHGANLIISSSIGQPDKIRDSRKGIINVLISLVIILSSYLLLNTINPKFTKIELSDVITTKDKVDQAGKKAKDAEAAEAAKDAGDTN